MMVPLLLSKKRRSAGRIFARAGFLFLIPWVAARAEPRLSDQSVEEDLKSEASSPAPDSSGSLFEFSQEGWNQARETVEAAERPAPPPGPRPPVGGEPLTGISVDLPYDSGLSISGRKLIAFKMAQIRRKSAESAADKGLAQNQNDVEMRQELQVRIKGKVGRKITVNVDFDDTKEDKKDISVVYQGDPGEFVQEAAFGDITLSLPSTEFVSFSKQLFGVRTKLQYKNASLLAIGSRTKGTTETRRFNGATKFERRIIKDVDFVKQQYYSVSFTTKTIQAGTEQIWRDDNILTNNNTVTISTDVQDVAAVSTYSGNFDRLKPGDDYTLDAARGILFFRRRVDDRAVIAIDYEFTDGTRLSDLNTPGRLKVIKTDSNKPLTSPVDPLETAYRREIKTFYSLGNIKIVRDNDLGNFILRTIDGNQNDLGVLLTSDELLQYKPTIEVDFDLGVFNVDWSTGPFDPAGYLRVKDPQLYEPSPTTKFSFLTEYRYRLRDFQLRPNIVFGSERVTVNGRLMKSEIDYFMDPGSGLLQFFNEDELNETSQIEVTYDYAPFGGQLGQTLVGGRAELAVVPGRFLLGSSFLYTFAPKTTVVPDVRSTPSSLMVLEADGRLTDVNVPFLPVKLSLTGEVAQSREDPNLYGSALVDSMEGLAQEDAVVMDQNLWPLGANPDAYGVPTSSGSVVVSDAVSVKLKDVVSSGANVSDSENLRVLPVSFKLDRKPGDPGQPEEASILQALSKTGGRDFSKKKYLEMWLEGFGSAGTGVDLLVSAGSLNEDSDRDGKSDTEDRSPNPDGTLNEGEDVGYTFNGWGPDGIQGTADDVSFPIGVGNGRLDAEDSNGGGFLTADSVSPVAVAQLSALPPGTTVTKQDGTPDTTIVDLGFSGWRFIRVPLNAIFSNPDAFTNVQHVRLTFRAPAGGGAKSSHINIGKIAFVGTTWETPVASPGATMEIAAVNNLDNPNYKTLIGNPAYNELYGDQADNRTREQALQLKFTLPVASSATTRSVYGSARDFSHHRNFNFFFQTRDDSSVQTGESLFVQMGTETDYFEFEREVGIGSKGAWTLETLSLVDLNNDGTPDTLRSTTVNSTVTVVGSPTLSRLGQIKIGVRNRTGGPITSELWVNEIYVSGSRTRIGNARRFAADASWNGWGTFGGIFRNVDRNFQTLTSPVVNQDRQELSGYANLTRFRFMPLTGSFYKNQTVTPTALQTGQSQLVSVLSEGVEDNAHVRGDGQFLFPNWPALAYSAERTVTESTDRQERRDRNLYTGSLDYAVPGRLDLMPGKYTFRPLPESVFVKYSRGNYFLSYFPEKKETQISASTDPVSQRNAIFSNAQTAEVADDWTGRMTFVPWVGLSLTPTYSQRRVTEEREFSDSDLAAVPSFSSAQSYEKSFSQSRGVAGSWKIFSWLEPRLTYTRSGTETNGLPTSSSPTAAGLKTLDRASNGDLFLNIAPRDIFPNLKLVRSLNLDGSFRVDSSDTYDGVPKDYVDWRRITPFQLNKVERKDGSSMYGLLAPLSFDSALVSRRQLTARNTLRFAFNWTPLDWLAAPYRLDPFKTVNINNTVTNINEHTETTLTARDVTSLTWPDMILTIRDTEKWFFLERWVGGSQANFRWTRKKSETFKEDFSENATQGLDYRFAFFTRYDVFLSLSKTAGETRALPTGLLKTEVDSFNHSFQVGTKWGSWRLTPSVGLRSDVSKDGTGRFLQDLQSQTASVLGRFDRSYPGGFRFPFTKKVFSNVNRLTLDAKLGFERRTSSLNFERDNTDTYTGDATGEWEISRNFRFSFGGKLGLVNNRARSEDGFMTVELNTQLVIQF